MDRHPQAHAANLRSQARELQNEAFAYLLKATDKPVDWAYEVWDQLVEDLHHQDNHVRAIAAQVLANLAQSDPKNRMRKDFPALLEVTKDERFVTARHSLQSIWKVGREKKMRSRVVEALADRFATCTAEKNCTLIRYDIIHGLRNLYEAVQDESIRSTALELIETEEYLKYRRKYAGVWK